jgi:hypothetical protein
VVLVGCGWVFACTGNLSGPAERPLASGRWTGNGACLSVTDTDCNLAVGCGHGQFKRPIVRRDGIFEADGTYRIEVGPISIDPAPPAHFSGYVDGSRLILSVMPTSVPLQPATYEMRPTTAGTCPIPCL